MFSIDGNIYTPEYVNIANNTGDNTGHRFTNKRPIGVTWFLIGAHIVWTAANAGVAVAFRYGYGTILTILTILAILTILTILTTPSTPRQHPTTPPFHSPMIFRGCIEHIIVWCIGLTLATVFVPLVVKRLCG